MGAISGIVNFGTAAPPIERPVLERMSETMRHRGSDRTGIWVRGGVGLAHRGLAVEHEARGSQPLTSADGTTAIAFSGQLFNRRELRHRLDAAGGVRPDGSDADIVLRCYEAYGESCVERFNGQFAFAIWDARRNSALLARDALGICPLHYAISGEALIFSSEAKGILEHPAVRPSADEQAVVEALLCGALFDGRTMFESVRSLEPGSVLTAVPSGHRTAVYWSVPRENGGLPDDGGASCTERLPELLQDAIRVRIDDDGDWGVLLSGGTDSSALTAWAACVSGAPVQTFSIDFPSRWRGSDADDHYAAMVADALGTRHRSFLAGPEEYFSALEQLAWYVERPYNKAAATMYLLALRLAPYARYVLSGEGVDEMLAGYVGARGLGLDDGLAGGAIRHFPWAPYVETVRHLFSDAFSDQMRVTELFESRLRDALAQAPAADSLNQGLYLYTTHFLRELLALHEQGSLAAGVETRFPFLDRRSVELLAPLPSSLKFRDGRTKAIWRTVIKGLVPDQVLERRKTHLPMPCDPAAIARQLEIARELLCQPASRTACYFDRARLSRFLDTHALGAGAEMLTVWQVSMNLLTLELLYRQFRL